MSKKTESNSDNTSEEKDKLMKEIYLLRSAIYRYENKINFLKFGYVAENLPKSLLNSTKEKVSHVPDVLTILKRDLYKCAGIDCFKVGDEFVFQFPAVVNKTKKLYSVQILNNAGHGSLGKWVMPESIDMSEILEEQPLEDINNIRDFVKVCKQYIDCYTYRAQQFYELKEYLSDSKNLSLDTNMQYTIVILRLSGMKHINTQRSYDNMLHLFYKSNEVLPYLMKVESVNIDDVLSESETKMINKYFKCFKKFNLKTAFEKTVSNTDVFVIKKVPYEDITVIDLEDEDDQAVEFLKIIRRKQDKKKNEKKSLRENNNSEDFEKTGLDKISDSLSDMTEETNDKNATAKRTIKTAIDHKQRTLDFTKGTVEAKVITDGTEVNNNTPTKRLLNMPELLEKSSSKVRNSKKMVDNEIQITEVKKTKEIEEIWENPKDAERAGNTAKRSKKQRKSVRWQLEAGTNSRLPSLGESLMREVVDPTNSTPLSEALKNRDNLRPSFDDMSEIVRTEKVRSKNHNIAENEETNEEGMKENIPESDSDESEIIEDRAELLKDLELLKEKNAIVSKSNKGVRRNKEKRHENKNNKTKKQKRM